MIICRARKPLAIDSPDHLMPFGTAIDSSVYPEFNRRLYEIIPPPYIRLLDLGCAGGGFVRSILDDGGFAIGVEGSDYSKIRNRAEWANIPGNLFVADLTEEIAIGNEDHDLFHDFNVITAWEFLEHITEDGLYGVFDNIISHAHISNQKTMFLGSISTIPDVHRGIALHQTIKPHAWWIHRIESEGWVQRPDLEAHFGDHWLRGPASPQPVPCSFFFAFSWGEA